MFAKQVLVLIILEGLPSKVMSQNEQKLKKKKNILNNNNKKTGMKI